MTGVNWDVTEERIREEKLAESLAQEKELAEKAQAGSRAKSEFLAVMSHEIRTPMNGILGFSELLAAAPNLPDDCRDYVKTIASSGEALLRIIDDILDFSRLEAGGLKIEPTLFSTREILQDVRTLLAPRASEKHLEFLLAVEDGVPEHLWNDAGRLRQILINLAGNALKFTAHGSITLGLRPARNPIESREPAVEFFVRDTGMGIPADKLAHVFEPFAQADSSISRRYGGTGLGLAISRNLVELMGGKLSVQSKVGEGSEFAVALPIDMPHGAAPAAQDSAREDLGEAFAASHPLRILLVDDDPVNLKLMLIMLRKLGYEPLTARDGVEAVEIYRRERPDCILMDLQMPRKGGHQATIEIREMEDAAPGSGHAYIAALTADIVEEDRRQCFEVGMDAHMTKPIKRAVLAQNLERACERKSRA
jgi:CheY-like chemotaxis protein